MVGVHEAEKNDRWEWSCPTSSVTSVGDGGKDGSYKSPVGAGRSKRQKDSNSRACAGEASETTQARWSLAQ